MKIKCLALLMLLCLLLSGCMSRDLEEQLLVIVLGIDETAEDFTRITVKVPSNSDSGSSPPSTSEGDAASGGEQMGYLLLEATGREFSDAVNLLHATTPRTLNFSQTREVVIGEKAAKSAGFMRLLHDIYALPRMRAQAALVICKDDANTFATEQKPYVGMRLSRYVETSLSNYAGKGFVPNITLGEGLRDLGYGFKDPLLIYAAVNDYKKSQSPDTQNVLDANAGTLPRKSVSPVEFFGAAATDGVSVSGVLTGYEMALIHLLQGDVQSLNIQTESRTPVPIFARLPATLEVDLSTSPATLHIFMACEAHYSAGLSLDAGALADILKTDIEKTVSHLQAMRCDGIGFGNLAVRQFSTAEKWAALSWRDIYCAARVHARVTVQLREN